MLKYLLKLLKRGRSRSLVKKPELLLLDEQFEWMTGTLAFIKREFPEAHADLMVRLRLHMACPTPDTPRQVTEMIVNELRELKHRLPLSE
jgi:hypothetical protein